MFAAQTVMVRLITRLQLTSMHFYAWKKGLKTGMPPLPFSSFFLTFLLFLFPGCYYLRTRAAVDAIKFTVDSAAAGKADCA
jgi:hypothetical protein